MKNDCWWWCDMAAADELMNCHCWWGDMTADDDRCWLKYGFWWEIMKLTIISECWWCQMMTLKIWLINDKWWWNMLLMSYWWLLMMKYDHWYRHYHELIMKLDDWFWIMIADFKIWMLIWNMTGETVDFELRLVIWKWTSDDGGVLEGICDLHHDYNYAC